MAQNDLEKRLLETEKKLQTLQGTVNDLLKRVTLSEDIEEIKQLRYVNALIEADWDAVMECFAEDATFFAYLIQEEIKGKAAIEKWFKESIAKNHVGKEGDFVVHPIISVDGDTATDSWLLYDVLLSAHRPGSILGPGIL